MCFITVRTILLWHLDQMRERKMNWEMIEWWYWSMLHCKETTKNIKSINIERFQNCFHKTNKLKYCNNVIIHTCWWPHKIIGRYRHILMLKNVPSYFEGTDHAVISYIIKLINFLSLQVTRLKKLSDLIPNYHS